MVGRLAKDRQQRQPLEEAGIAPPPPPPSPAQSLTLHLWPLGYERVILVVLSYPVCGSLLGQR